MRARHVLAIACASLRASMLRMALAVLGIVAAIAAVVSMVSLGEGAIRTMQRQLEVLGRNVVVIVPGTKLRSGYWSTAGSVHTLVPADADAIRRECPSVNLLSPGVRGAVQVVFENRNRDTLLLGMGVEYFRIREWWPGRGTAFDADAEARGAAVCVLGATVARDLFGDRDPVGQSVRMGALPVRVLGVLEPKGQSDGQDQDDLIVMPWTTAMRRVRGVRHLSVIVATARSASLISAATQEVTEVLARRHGLQEGEQEDFTVRSLSEVQSLAQHITKVLMRLVIVVALASLAVGGIGVMNIMLVTVVERTSEIGLRLAVGARRRDVLMQFLTEAVVLSGLGGLAGIGTGVALSLVLPLVTPWQTRITLAPIAGSFLFSAAVGIVFGFYPALRASRLEPIEALRRE